MPKDSSPRTSQQRLRIGQDRSPEVVAQMHQAVALHQSGQLAMAEMGYREILKQVPMHFDALHLMGVLQHQTGRLESAVEFFRQAISINSDEPAAHYNMGVALEALNRAEAALASYNRALKLKPDYAAALNNRGNVLQVLNRPKEALVSYDRALALRPDYPEALNNRGNTLRILKRPQKALADYDNALKLRPGFADAFNNRGNALRDLGRPEEALASYDHALAFSPEYAEALRNRGLALQHLKRREEALASYDRALALKPNYVEALNDRGNVLRAQKRPGEALISYDQALALKPDYADAFNNRGAALQDLEQPEEALWNYERALTLNPKFAEALNNCGMALKDLRRPKEALASFDRALKMKTDYAAAHVNEGLCRLLIGDLERGWQKNEWRWQIDPHKPWARNFPQPLWIGQEPLAEKTILLHAEQGFGDTIHFCRYARLVAQQRATVLLEVPAPLKSLLSTLEGPTCLFARGDPLPAFDYHCPLLSLPLAFKTTLETIPADIPYIKSDSSRVDHWAEMLGSKTLRRVGIAWSGNKAADPRRSIPLSEFGRLFSSQVQFVSVQKEVLPTDEPILAARPDIRHFGHALHDFADTAALIELMDLVITIDTSVAHLAGAMGKTVWILLPFVPDWRWLLDREDSLWYPTARLLRQPARGDWASVIGRVHDDLQKLTQRAA